MAVSKEDILETISNMSVMDVVDLISAMEEKFGVSAAAPVAVAAGPAAGGDAAAAEEQTEFDVVMTSFGENKVGAIKAVRVITGLPDVSFDCVSLILKHVPTCLLTYLFLRDLRLVAIAVRVSK